MTIKELYNQLIKAGIAEDKFYLHGLYGSTDDDGKLALVMKKGTYTIEYQVYYSERGGKNSLTVFTDENEACSYIYQELIENKELEERHAK